MSEQKLLIATTNRGKVSELRKLLADLPVKVISPEDLPQAVPDCIEKGGSFCENAEMKARHWFDHSGLASLADDSGLAVDTLDGAPGIYSARFAGDGATDRDNLEHLLERLHPVDRSQRKASFICCLALCRTNGEMVTFHGRCDGLILEAPRGRGGFGYDPVFYYPPLGRTFAQLNAGEKNRVSHRGQALQSFREWLTENKL